MTNKERFAESYRRHLHVAVTACPQDYGYIAGRVDEVADKMLAALDRRTANKDSYAFKKACKELGIKHTYQAIYAFISQ